MPSQRPADRTLRAPTRHRAKRGGLLLLATATLLLIPVLAYADVPVATISGPEVVVEGSAPNSPNQVLYTVTLTGGTGSVGIEIEYTVTGTATEDVDYTKPSGKLTIAQGAISDTFMIDVLHDEVDEVGETMIVTLTSTSTARGNVAIGSPNQVTTTIRSAATVLVKIDDPAQAVRESDGGANASFVVTVTVPTGVTLNNGDLTLGYKTVAGTATAGVDFTAAESGATVAITGVGSERTGTVSVPILDDMLAEDNETFMVMLTLAKAPDGVAFERSTARGTITDDQSDTMTVTVTSDEGTDSQTGTVFEGSAATFTVTLGGGTSTEDVVANYTVSDGSVEGEVDNDDYVAPGGALTIPAGQASGTITIVTHPDGELEQEETLKVTLTGASTEAGSITQPTDTAQVKVADRGRKVTVSIADITVDEGDDAVFTVELSGKVDEAVLLTYAFGGTASANQGAEDYESTPSPIEIKAGELSVAFTVQTLEDDRAEGPETLTAALTLTSPDPTSPTARVGLGKATGTATIIDANVLTATLDGPARVPQGSPAIFTVELDGGTGTEPVMIEYGVGGSATAQLDYVEPTGELEILAAQSIGRITIDTLADQEVGETLVVTLNKATTSKGTAIVGTPNRVTTTTATEETVTVSVAADDGTLDEGESEIFTVSLTGGPRSDRVVVNYTVGGGVTVDDYNEPSSGTLTFETNDTSKSITLTATDDRLEEPAETMAVTLSLPDQTAKAVVGRGTATATIPRNDTLTAHITGDQDQVHEGSDATFTVTLNQEAESTADVVVSYKVSGDVTSADYTGGTTGTLTIPAQMPAGTITIPTVDDSVPETDETLTVTLTEATTDGRVVSLNESPEEAAIEIVSNDGPVLLSVRDAGAVDESENAVFTVSLSGQVSTAVDVGYQTQDGTATQPGDDYESVSDGMVSIPVGETSATFTINVKEDTVAEASETFSVELPDNLNDSLPNGVAIDTASAEATIRDNEELKVSITGPQTQTVDLGATSAEYTVTLTDGTGSAPIMVSYREGNSTRTVTIPTGDTSETFTIDPSARTKNQAFVVQLTGATTSNGRVSVDRSNDRVTTRVINPADDTVSVSVSSPTLPLPETEGQSRTFTVSRPSLTIQTVVRYTVSGSATRGLDYSGPSSGTLTIPVDASAASDSITVTVVDDMLAEDAETITVTLLEQNFPDGLTLGTAQATTTISANDALTAAVTRQGPTVLEGSATTFTVKLTQTGGAPGAGSEDVVVSYTTNGSTATEGEDYTEPSGKLTIRAGQTEGTIEIRTLTDDVLESGETLVVALDRDGTTTTAGTVSVNAEESASTTITDRQGTVLLSVRDAGAVDESENAVFTVSLSGQVSTAVDVGYQTQDGTATQPGDDYESVSDGMVSIPVGETSATFTINVKEDTVAEASETFSVELPDNLNDSLPNGVAIDTASAEATIRDNEELKVSITGPQTQTVDLGATSAEYTVTLTDGTGSAPIMVSYREGNSTRTVTIPTGDTSETFTIDPSARTKNQAFVVQLTGATTSNGRVSVDRSNDRVTTRVINPADDTVSVSVSSPTLPLPETEGQSRTFTVSRPSLTIQTVVRYTVSGSATRGLDYSGPSSGTLTIPVDASAASDSITVTVVDDMLAEDAETITVTLLEQNFPDGLTLGTAQATTTISANDALTAAVTRQGPTVLEGSATTFTVKLTQTGGAPGAGSEDVVVSYTTNGSTATEGEDYTEPSGKLTIRAGQTEGTIEIRTLTDDVLESGETLVVALDGDGTTTTAGTVSVNDGESEQTIITDRQTRVLVTIADTTVDEAEEALFTVTLSGKVAKNLAMTWTAAKVTGDTADAEQGTCPPAGNETPDGDFCADSGSVEIPAGEREATFPVPTVDDTTAEASETFTLTLSALMLGGTPVTPADGISFGDNTATATITDDALTATIEGDASVDEGEAAVYTVSVAGGTFGTEDEEVTVTWSTEDSSATANDDFAPASGTLIIGAEQPSATFTIQTVDDEIVELGEEILVSLTAVTADDDPVRTGLPARTMIVDDDGAVRASVMTNPDRPVVAEGDPAEFLVELSGTVADADVTLRYTIAGSATAEDYIPPVDPTVVISAGEMSTTISVATQDDTDDEPDETLSVTLQGDDLPEGVEIDPSPASVTITDHEIQASVTAEQQTVDEGSAAVFTVSLTVDGTAAGARNRSGVEVQYAMVGTATASVDFDAPTGTLTIPIGQSSGTITITTKQDRVVDRNETLVVRLTDTSVLGAGLAVPGTAVQAETRIRDESSARVSVANATADEGRPAQFAVSVSAPVEAHVVLVYSTRDGTANADSGDYTAVTNGRLTIAGRQTSATISVATGDDQDGEPDETFTLDLDLAADSPAGVDLANDTATATIRDDDLKLGDVPSETVREGEVATITWPVEVTPQNDSTLNYRTVDGTATAGDDFTAGSGTVQVRAGATSVTVTVATLSDDDVGRQRDVHRDSDGRRRRAPDDGDDRGCRRVGRERDPRSRGGGRGRDGALHGDARRRHQHGGRGGELLRRRYRQGA